MVNLKFLGYIFNPKLLTTLLFLDLTGLLNFISKYVFADLTYLKFLVIACIIDLITGVWKVIVNEGIKSVTSRGLRDTVSKLISYGSFLIIIHILTHFEINGQVSSSFLWMNKVALEFLILVEIKSVYENIIRINPKLDFVDSVLQKIINTLKNKK
jgi:hypothetical protein